MRRGVGFFVVTLSSGDRRRQPLIQETLLTVTNFTRRIDASTLARTL